MIFRNVSEKIFKSIIAGIVIVFEFALEVLSAAGEAIGAAVVAVFSSLG